MEDMIKAKFKNKVQKTSEKVSKGTQIGKGTRAKIHTACIKKMLNQYTEQEQSHQSTKKIEDTENPALRKKEEVQREG